MVKQPTPDTPDTSSDELDFVVSTDLVSLLREGELGSELGLGDIRDEVSEVQRRFRQLQPLDSRYTRTEIKQIVGQASVVGDLVRQMSAYTGVEPDARQKRELILNRASEVLERAVGTLRPIELEMRMDAGRLQTTQAEIDLMLASLRDVSASVSVARHADAFRRELKADRIQAGLWLILSIVVSGFLIYRLGSIPPVKDNATVAMIVNHYAANFVLLSVSLIFLAMFTKLFRTSLARAAVNAHRVRSLETFEGFIQAAEPGPVRDAIMLETTRAIFSHVDAGVGSRENEGSGEIALLSALLRK